MTTQTATDELTAKAAAAWAMLTRATEPMPPDVAVDFVQDVCGERDAAKAALYAAAANELTEAMSGLPSRWIANPWSVILDLRLGKFAYADALATKMRSFETDMQSPDWLPWCDRADVALNLCRLIEAA